jgi:hypothetical protein
MSNVRNGDYFAHFDGGAEQLSWQQGSEAWIKLRLIPYPLAELSHNRPKNCELLPERNLKVFQSY